MYSIAITLQYNIYEDDLCGAYRSILWHGAAIYSDELDLTIVQLLGYAVHHDAVVREHDEL